MHQRARSRPWATVGLAILIVLLAVIAYAWIDGGREPLRPIVETVRPQVGEGGR